MVPDSGARRRKSENNPRRVRRNARASAGDTRGAVISASPPAPLFQAVAPGGSYPPAAREALRTAPHGRRGGLKTSGRSCAVPGRHRREMRDGGGGTRGAVISASPPTPPCPTRPHADAGCTRGAEYSASRPASAGEKGEVEGHGAREPSRRRCIVTHYRGGLATVAWRRRRYDEVLSSAPPVDAAQLTRQASNTGARWYLWACARVKSGLSGAPSTAREAL